MPAWVLRQSCHEHVETTCGRQGGDEWLHLPAACPANSAAFAFADGSAALHHWLKSKTVPPSAPPSASLPLAIPVAPPDEQTDFDWVLGHLSVENGRA